MAAPGKGTVSREGYRAYIQSAEWRAVRQRYFASKMPQECFLCATPRKPGMHLHHRTYKNLGAERLMDLVPVCPDCHELIHAIYKSDKKWKVIGLWAATTKAKNMVRRRKSPYGDFGDLVRPARKRFESSTQVRLPRLAPTPAASGLKQPPRSSEFATAKRPSELPHVVKTGMVTPPSPAEIEAACTERGGFTEATLAAWGFPWPPPKGWRKKMVAEWEAHERNRS